MDKPKHTLAWFVFSKYGIMYICTEIIFKWYQLSSPAWLGSEETIPSYNYMMKTG